MNEIYNLYILIFRKLMKIEKICEYLSEIGILEYENINIFLDIYTKLNNTKISDKIIDTLAIYINNNYIKNNQLQNLSKSIISSFNNYQLILKYRILNNMKNILYSKIQTKYIIFFLNLSFYLLRKKNITSKINLSNKKKKNVKRKENKLDDNIDENKYNEENTELISSDDERECTFTPKINKNFKGYKKAKNNIESQVYYSPAFNISSKFPINNYQNNIPNNNYYNINNINDNSYTDNNYSHYSNYNNFNISNETKSNRSYNILDNNQMFNNDYLLNEYNSNYYSNNSFYSSNNSRLLQSNINYNNILQMNNQNSLMRNYPNIQNTNIYNYNRNEEFFNKELEHIQRVKDKIQNMKIEKLNKIKEECTFEPKINTNYKSFYYQNKELDNNNNAIIKSNIFQEQLQQNEPNIQFQGQKSYKNIPSKMKNLNNQKIIKIKKKEPLEIIQENNNLNQNSLIIKKKKDNKKRSYSEKKKGIKIIEDLSLARKRRTDKTKRLMKERNFTPKIRKSDKYKDKVTMSFQDRVLKSIELKNKYKKGKNNDNNYKLKNEDILSPGEMVRYVDKNANDIKNENNKKISEIEDDELYKKVNNTEYNNENINKEEEKKESDNYSFSNDIINKKEIEKNKMLLMNRIKDEHKIGFKARKDDDEDIKEKEDNKDINKNIEEMEINKEKNEIKDNMLKLGENAENKNSKFSLNSNEFHSKALKSILEKNKNEN